MTGSVIWSGSMDNGQWQRKMNKLSQSSKEKYLEEYMVLNMKLENGKVGRIEN